jgi:hypothetical protein
MMMSGRQLMVLRLMLTISRRRSMAQEQEIEGGWSGLVASEPTAAAIEEQDRISRNNPRGQGFSEFFRRAGWPRSFLSS